MLIIGLTGGIASGKSTVSKLLSKHDIPIIDADIIAREVIEPGTSGFKLVVNHFGPDRVLKQDGSLDRAAVGDIVFHDQEQRKWLNGVVHPRVRRAIAKAVVLNWLRGQWAVVLDVPLLIEAGLHLWVGDVVVVFVNERLQLSRLLARPSDPPLTKVQAEARIASQLPLATKTTYASSVLDNSGTPSDLSAQVDNLVKKWHRQQGGGSGWWWRICWLIPPVGLAAGALCLFQNWIRLKRTANGRRRGRGEVIDGRNVRPGESIELKELDNGSRRRSKRLGNIMQE